MNRVAAAICITLISSVPALSQDPLNRDAPQSTVVAFLDACHARNYQKAWRYLDLRNVPEAKRWQQGSEIAKQLEQILDRDTQFDVASLSRDPQGDHSRPSGELVATINQNGKNNDLTLERVSLKSGTAIWLFSPATVALVPVLANSFTESPIEKYLPRPLVNWTLLDTPLWRWIALFLLAAVLALASKYLFRIVLIAIQALLKRAAPRLQAGWLLAFGGPLRLLLVLACFRAGMEWVEPAPRLHILLERVIAVLFFSAIASLLIKATDFSIRRLRAGLAARHHTFAHSFLPLAARVVKILIVLIAITAVLANWGYNTTTILAGLGVGGIALALAAQKTIENLFGGVAVITDRPVSVGDFCRFDNQVGTVEDIGLRSTRIRTLDRTLVTVPNGQFSSMTLENLTGRDKMWFHYKLNLKRDTTPDQIRNLLRSIGAKLKKQPKIEVGPLPVRFVGIGASSLDIEIFAYVATIDGDEFNQIQQDLLLWILDEVTAAGTALAA